MKRTGGAFCRDPSRNQDRRGLLPRSVAQSGQAGPFAAIRRAIRTGGALCRDPSRPRSRARREPRQTPRGVRYRPKSSSESQRRKASVGEPASESQRRKASVGKLALVDVASRRPAARVDLGLLLIGQLLAGPAVRGIPLRLDQGVSCDAILLD
jgi:hypothetical protein